MSLLDVHTNHGDVTGCDIDGMFVAGEYGRRIDKEIHPEDYDDDGHELKPHEVVYLAGSMTVELAQSA